jgi:hypothetical protein
VKTWLPPGPKRTLPKARAATWAAQVKKPQSNFTTAFEGKLYNHKWGLVAPERKPK